MEYAGLLCAECPTTPPKLHSPPLKKIMCEEKKSWLSELPLPPPTSRTYAASRFRRKDTTMGTGKKEATRRVRQGKVGDGLNNVRVKGENFYRSVKAIFHEQHFC
jgi:hypothetical protein